VLLRTDGEKEEAPTSILTPEEVQHELRTCLPACDQHDEVVESVADGTLRRRLPFRDAFMGRDPLRCPHYQREMAVWRLWHQTYGVIYDEGQVIKRGTYASTAQRAGP